MGNLDTALRRDDLAQYVGQVVSVTFDPTLLVLSYLISLVGAASTLELIHRRTSRRGYYNKFDSLKLTRVPSLLLFGASITMGGVAIWSMHYIGNRATTLLNGEPELQIAYSVGVTVASFFVPIIVLLAAFFVVTGTTTSSNQISWWRVSASGTLSGGAICGMHYLGNASISNYRCDYLSAFVAGSVVIAAVASTVALSLFFVFRSSWTNSWWKRVGCAFVLAGAVSGMHWCAVMGTRYTLKHVNSNSDISSRNTTVIVTACLSFTACLMMAGLAIYSARVRKGYANRAQRITLAAAVFDERGRILVTPDGFLPSEVVTSTFLQKAQNETFSTAHPLFHWLFQASRSWPSISALIDKMNHHLASLPHHERNVRTGIELVDKEGHIIENYDTIFSELFCVAASALAVQMNEDLVDVGILWDEIVATGGHPTAGSISEESTTMGSGDSTPTIKKGLDDLAEKGSSPKHRNGQGHLMFLVRKVESGHVDHLAAAGYCFAEPRHVSHIIRSKMQIRSSRLEEKFRSMERYARGTMLDPGVHIGLFAVRTQVHQMGFDVLVRKQARNLLPSIELPLDRLEPAHTEFLRRMDGMTLGSLHRRLERANELASRDATFAGFLLDAIRNLRASVQDPVFDNARLVAQVTQVPCNPPVNEARPLTCSLIAFTLMIPIHVRVDAPAHEFIPLPFFKTQQLVYKNSPHNAAFGRSVHHAVKLVSSSRERIALTPRNRSVSSLPLYNGNGGDSELASEGKPPSLVSDSLKPVRKQPPPKSFGGIMISQEVTVDVEEARNSVHDMPDMPPPSRTRDASPSGVSRQMSQRTTLQSVSGGGGNPALGPRYDQAIELKEVSTVLGMGLSKVEVRKEGDDVVTTFVDDLFSTCIDTPRRM
ncbi:hypothetical protein NEMBOFW57_010965 [Staphylotrichum longicolle]|uniref:MHYT domain-containing protein n=1 Tax=Staphylotrichum longicolle TaxID=669026 RepID=A0AAD4ESG4_9PEZI|nr:hypothetical protein NEMBOFW57_010965 [Staphylotrichum longicolle]